MPLHFKGLETFWLSCVLQLESICICEIEENSNLASCRWLCVNKLLQVTEASLFVLDLLRKELNVQSVVDKQLSIFTSGFSWADIR